MTKNLAVEWGRFGIRVVRHRARPDRRHRGHAAARARRRRATKAKATIPAGRFGTIDEIAAAAVYLRSPAAAYVTGHVLVVDGGHCVATPPMLGAMSV